MESIKVITTIFDTPLTNHENECLRGAIIEKLSDTENPLVHNHLNREGALRYDYPLVQYKNINEQAAIVCLGEGTKVIEELISRCDLSFMIGTRSVQMQIKELNPTFFVPQISEQGFYYRITRWQALNSGNYQTYKELVALTDKIRFLEKILTGHILALYRGLGICVNVKIDCSLTKLSDPYTDKYKGITTTLFNIEFITNLSLPLNSGLGKGTSIGFGIINELKP